MTRPMLHDKITPQHLDRRAVIYLRQSSDKQVRENRESQRLQYGLRDRAVALGWTQVEVIDIDLGRSASLGAAQRDGFDRLVGPVARGEVGIVMNREVSSPDPHGQRLVPLDGGLPGVRYAHRRRRTHL